MSSIVARDLRVVRGGRTVLDQLSVSVEEGVTALLGPNGAGKSSLLRTMMGLEPLAAGDLDVLGRTHDTMQSSRAIWSRTGYLPQHLRGPARQRVEDYLGHRAWLRGRPAGEIAGDVEHALKMAELASRR